MATTTNYSWTTPDDTALVKDGAAAIRSLGSSIDTTTKALNPSTTLGDIEYRSATANTNTRLPIGTANQVLAVNGSGVPAWTTISTGGSMTLLSTTTLSGISTTVSSISQSYKNLYIEWQGVTADTDFTFDIQLNGVNGGHWSSVTNSQATSVTAYTDNVIKLTNNADTGNTDGRNAGSVTVYNYASTTARKPFDYATFFVASSGTKRSVFGGGGFDSTSAVTSLKFNNVTGATFAGGTLRIYGVN